METYLSDSRSIFPMFRRLLTAHQKLKEGSLKKYEDKSSVKTDLAFECKFFFLIVTIS